MIMKLILSLFILILCGFAKSTSAQRLLGFTAGYDDHFLQVGISVYQQEQKKIFNQRGSIT
jgi:hypothetical protein